MPIQSLVTVIIPVYNCERFVAEAVQSALDQDYGNKEIIVVNDGSTDGTLRVLRQFGDSIRVVDQKNGGPPIARNNGLRAMRGDYVAFLDADDVWIQGKLAAQVAHLDAHPDVGTVLTNWYEWPAGSDGRYPKPDFYAEPIKETALDERYSGWLYNKLLFDCVLLTTTVMMRASVVREIGDFDVTMFNGDDYDYWIRASRVAKISRLKGIGALYRVLPGSVSRKPTVKNFEYDVIRGAVARWGLEGPDGSLTNAVTMQQRLETLVLRHAHDHLLRGDPRLAYSGFLDVLRRDRFNPKLWINVARASAKIGVKSLGVFR